MGGTGFGTGDLLNEPLVTGQNASFGERRAFSELENILNCRVLSCCCFDLNEMNASLYIRMKKLLEFHEKIKPNDKLSQRSHRILKVIS